MSLKKIQCQKHSSPQEKQPPPPTGQYHFIRVYGMQHFLKVRIAKQHHQPLDPEVLWQHEPFSIIAREEESIPKWLMITGMTKNSSAPGTHLGLWRNCTIHGKSRAITIFSFLLRKKNGSLCGEAPEHQPRVQLWLAGEEKAEAEQNPGSFSPNGPVV